MSYIFNKKFKLFLHETSLSPLMDANCIKFGKRIIRSLYPTLKDFDVTFKWDVVDGGNSIFKIDILRSVYPFLLMDFSSFRTEADCSIDQFKKSWGGFENPELEFSKHILRYASFRFSEYVSYLFINKVNS